MKIKFIRYSWDYLNPTEAETRGTIDYCMAVLHLQGYDYQILSHEWVGDTFVVRLKERV